MSDIIPQDTPTKQCTKCGTEYPATLEYFHAGRGRYGVHPRCKQCRSTRKTPLPEPVPDGYKRCTQCKEVWPLSNFSQEKRNPSGVRGACKVCLNAQSKEYRDKLGDVLVERKAQDYQKHKEKRQAHHKQYYQEHKEELDRWSTQYRQQNKEKLSERARRWRQTERGKILKRAAHRRRRAHKRNAPGSFTPEQFQEQIERQKQKCYYCGKRSSMWHPDHVVPLSRGGSNSIDNIVAACPTCNLKKHNKLPHEWPESGRLF